MMGCHAHPTITVRSPIHYRDDRSGGQYTNHVSDCHRVRDSRLAAVRRTGGRRQGRARTRSTVQGGIRGGVRRELILVEVAATPQKRAEIVELAGLFEAKVVSVQTHSLTIQMVGEQNKADDFLKLLKPFRILDISRSGVIAVARGE